MMNEADFSVLNEHLEEVRPIFDAFCARHGFEYVNRQALGRYPRVRIQRCGATTMWFDLLMELDKEGRRFERFRRDLPYELIAGADVEVRDGSQCARFYKCFPCFAGTPFDHVGAVLEDEMERHLPTLEGWSEQYLREHGQRVKLGS